MFEITKSTVINSLKNINSDKINTSSLTLNSIRKIEFSNEDLSLEISISTTNSEEAKGLIVNQLKKDFTGIKNIDLNIIQKSSSKVSTHKDAKKDAILPELKILLRLQAVKAELVKVRSLLILQLLLQRMVPVLV